MRAPPVDHRLRQDLPFGQRSRHDLSLTTSMPLRKVIQGHPGTWTITDANLSPDNERSV